MSNTSYISPILQSYDVAVEVGFANSLENPEVLPELDW